MVKFSIIIPVFNSFDLMNECLESLENQTYNDFEVIVVDDCSTDDSFKKLQEYSKNSKLELHIFKNDRNLGPGETRNKAIENTNGKFLIFIDSDDYIEKNTLEILNKIIDKKKVDCIIFDYYHHTKAGTFKRKSLLNCNPGIISKSDALVFSSTNSWGKVYLLENIKENNVKFLDLKQGEDVPFNKLAIAYSDSIYYCNESLYNYISNENSLMHEENFENESNAISAFKPIYEKLNSEFPNEVESIFLKHYLYISTLILVKKGAKNSELKNYISECEEKFPNVYKSEMLKN